MTHSRLVLRLCVLLLVVTLVAACGQPAAELTGPDSNPDITEGNDNVGADPTGEILFVADGNVMRWDGDVERITEDVTAESPTWAPAGDRFAYVDWHDGYSDIIVADRDGDTLVQVTRNEPVNFEPYSLEWACVANWAIDPDWSAAGEQIIFASDQDGYEFECESRLSDPMFLFYSETWDAPPYILGESAAIDVPQEDPSLSPDGNEVAFIVRRDVTDTLRNTEIWTLDLNTAESEVLVTHPDGAYDPAWGPVGGYIAYVQRDGASNDVWIAPLNGDAPYRLTSVGTVASPEWSPDGKQLAFFRLVNGSFEAAYVDITADSNGTLTASEPKRLFSADNIDPSSGMSWRGD